MSILTHFMPLVFFYTPWKHHKTRGFLMFSRGMERIRWHEMGWYCCTLHIPHSAQWNKSFWSLPFQGITVPIKMLLKQFFQNVSQITSATVYSHITSKIASTFFRWSWTPQRICQSFSGTYFSALSVISEII